jgi:hypothetical protein
MNNGASFCKTSIVAIGCVAFFSLIILPSTLFAQTRGKVEVDKDPKVDSLIGNYLVGGKNTNISEAPYSTGYRVQIFGGSDRKGAFDAQAKFQDKYPGMRTYLSYLDPNFKVRIGDFRSRFEAEKMLQELRSAFTGLFIIREKINLPKLDTE